LTATAITFRYFFPLVPLLLLWAAKGAEELGQWASGLAKLNNRLLPRPVLVSIGLPVCAALILIGLSAFGTRNQSEFVLEQADHSQTRDAALWLRQYKPGPKRVAARHTIVPYYAEATLVQIPFADPEPTRRYLAAKRVDFMVLESQYAKAIPTIGQWIAHGVPDEHAHLIFDNADANGNRVVIYSWEQPQSDFAQTTLSVPRSHLAPGSSE
jgi:hypothetical protein